MGDRPTTGAGAGGVGCPVPVSVTVCGPPDALSTTVNVPVRAPLAVGAKVTEIWQVPPAVKEVPQLLVSAKSAEDEIWVIFSTAVPVLLNVTFCGALVLPTCCAPNVSEVALSDGWEMRPVAERFTV
jgi:hypothetical protein